MKIAILLPSLNRELTARSELTCRPCQNNVCSPEGDAKCLRALSIEQVFTTVRRQLRSKAMVE